MGSLGIDLLLTVKPVFSVDGATCRKICYNIGFNKIHLINPREGQFEFSLLVGLWHWKKYCIWLFLVYVLCFFFLRVFCLEMFTSFLP